MYFYVDESGQTGLNLFDKNQPYLYYGVLSSKLNVDILAKQDVKKLRKQLGVDRLHAAELGNGRLVDIHKEICRLNKKFDFKFSFHKVTKADHALISFFDQVFDQGLNPAVPWAAYWTPLRYFLLFKLAYLFDDELLKKSWAARITTNKTKAEVMLISICMEIISRVDILTDVRAKEIINDGLKWVIQNPSKINYNVRTKKDSLQISPNLVGFQAVLHGIANTLKKKNSKASAVIVDRQSEFNAAQEFISSFYQRTRNVSFNIGPNMPVMDLKHTPTVAINCTPGTDSIGLELVDIYIWIFKRHFEKKDLAPELYKIIQDQLSKGQYTENSISALEARWGKWFFDSPELSAEEEIKAKELYELQEERRKPYVVI